MWIARHKRIQLWHTARNILAIFYMWQISFTHSCEQKFNDVQSKAILSQIVIVGKIHSLELISSQQSADYNLYSGTIQVLSVLKQPMTRRDDDIIYRKQYVEVNGFVDNSERSSSNFSTAQHTSTTSATPQSTNHSCLSYVNLSQEYILFINLTSGAQGRPTYHTAQISTNYTKSDKKLIKDVLCDNCAQVPNAKSKRYLQVTEGASNYKINCRVEGNPPPDVRWYRDDVELDNSHRGIAIKSRRRKNVHTWSLRIKTVKLDHTATYRCVAINVLGEDVAKSRLTVMADLNDPTPPPPPGNVDWESINVDDLETLEPASHYISCTGKDKNFCLHGGECKIYPDGRYKHCRCTARYTGTRCEEANFLPPPPKPTPKPVIVTSSHKVPAGVELRSVVIALATVLVLLVILMLISAFYCAGWKYRSHQEKRQDRCMQSIPSHQQEASCLLEGNDSKPRPQQIVQCHSTASQTDPPVTSLQQLRRSLNLENHFPHTSSDVILRRKSSGAGNGRPSSQPIDRRLTRSRLSGTSTLTESKRVNDSEFDVLAERTPSSASVELEISGSASSCSDNPNHHTHSDRTSAEINSLHISESTLDSNESNRKRGVVVIPDQHYPTSKSPNNPPVTDKNANSKKYTFNRQNGAM